MSDNYDPLSTATTALTFRRLDALQDSVAAFGKTASGAPVAVLVAQDGTLQTRRLTRTTDEIVLIATDAQGVARPVLVDTQGRFSPRPLTPLPITDFDGVRVYLLGPASAQVQAKADADGTLNVNDAAARGSLASILGRLDLTTTQLRDEITGTAPTCKTLYALDQDLVAALGATQPRSISNFPSDYPDALAQTRLLSILGQLDVPTTQLRDAITGGPPSCKTLYDLWTAEEAIRAKLDRTLSEVFDLKTGYVGVTHTNNTSGLTLTVDLGPTGRRKVHQFISTGGAASVTTQVSRDGVGWRTWEAQSFSLATNVFRVLDIGFRYVRMTSPTTGVTLEFEVSAVR